MNEQEHSQDWQAFRYIAGEMSGDEVISFEEQLGDDQSCRESVAAAVELTEALAMVPTAEVSAANATSRTEKWNTRATWMGIGAAACLVLIMAARGLMTESVNDDVEGPTTSSEQLQALATAWTENALNESANTDDEFTSETLGEESEFANFDTEASEPPSWMLAAISSDVESEMSMTDSIP